MKKINNITNFDPICPMSTRSYNQYMVIPSTGVIEIKSGLTQLLEK